MKKVVAVTAVVLALMSFTASAQVPSVGTGVCDDGVLQLKQAEPQRAIDLLTQCLSGAPLTTKSRIAAHRNLVSAYLMTHRPLLAMKQIDHAMDLAPDDKAVDYMLRGYVHAYYRDFSTALLAFDQALRLDPELAEAMYQRAWVFEATGKREAAQNDYDKAYARGLAPRAWNDVLLFPFGF